jgi:hypothetical protein
MKHKLIAIVLITVLLFMLLGNGIACGPTTQYTLTISSTDGGNVTDPGEGTFTYDAGDVINLVATPDSGYQFVSWTGDVSTIDAVDAAATLITMNGNYTITANFGVNPVIIGDVPDINQPPTQTLPSTASDKNYCAPMAMVNILYYWDIVMGHADATGVTDGFPLSAANTTAEYIGYFMDTNNNGSKARGNDEDGHSGTRAKDIGSGTEEFARWDATHNFTAFPPPFSLPTGKLGYDWTMTSSYVTSDTFADAAYNESVAFYTTEIDNGRPLVVSFRYWNPVPTGISLYDPETEETIDVFAWGDPVSDSTANATNPYEEWNWNYVTDNITGREQCIGHAVTGVGYMFAWAPDGSGPYLVVIVHDNWPNTPKNIAIPWNHWNSCHAVHPGS